jgi:hypothetical protein
VTLAAIHYCRVSMYNHFWRLRCIPIWSVLLDYAVLTTSIYAIVYTVHAYASLSPLSSGLNHSFSRSPNMPFAPSFASALLLP